MDKRLTLWILAGMILGVAAGYAVHISFAPDSTQFEYLTKTFKLLSDIFLNLIKLLVAPLILSTIVVGIAHMGDSSALGRIGFRAITWFIIASFISIGLGLIMGWGVFGGIVFGLSLSVASTVVLLKTMQDRRLMETEAGFEQYGTGEIGGGQHGAQVRRPGDGHQAIPAEGALLAPQRPARPGAPAPGLLRSGCVGCGIRPGGIRGGRRCRARWWRAA